MTRVKPRKADWTDLEAGLIAARAIGALDIGQGAVAIGGRAIALEGIEGTDQLLARVAGMRGHGRLAGKMRGVLVKSAKPGQEMRADMPAIGPATFLGLELNHAANADCRPDADVASPASKVRILVIATREDLTIVREMRRLITSQGEEGALP